MDMVGYFWYAVIDRAITTVVRARKVIEETLVEAAELRTLEHVEHYKGQGRMSRF